MTEADAFDPRFWGQINGVLFDLDGVITPTAVVHERAWASLFDWFLSEHGDGAADRSAFTPADYKTYVDGKPRYDGVRSFLASRGVVRPEGDPSDEPGPETVCALGNRKNSEFNSIIDHEGIQPYPGSDSLLAALDQLGIPQGIVSSSKNARTVLAGAGYEDRFDVIVDGIVSTELGLPGKPAPDAFLLGAQRLGVDPSHTVVFEDAESGVAAGKAGRFALVIGVNRDSQATALLNHGADVVVDDLGQLVQAVTDAADRTP
jgi:beta-phosphoglucomutase family hydrolase